MDQARPLLIVNPEAGGGRARRDWPRLASEIRRLGIDFDAVVTTRSGEAVEIAAAAVRANRRVIAAVGGDGLINEVLNGFFDDERAIATQSSMAVIPFGTGNDTRRTFDIPVGLAAAELLRHGQPCWIDIGLATLNGRRTRFIDIAEAGIGAEVARLTSATPKVLGGTLKIFCASLIALLEWRHKNVRIVLDGSEVIELAAQAVTVANCRYYGGGMLAMPGAAPTDGWFDVAVTGALSKLDAVLAMNTIYAGTHFEDPRLGRWLRRFRAKSVSVSSQEPVNVELDGELVGQLPAEFRIMPSIVRLVVPRGWRPE